MAPKYPFFYEELKFLVQNVYTEFLKWSIFVAFEALQQVEGTKKNKTKVVRLIFMKFGSRNNLDQLDRLTP